MNEETDVLIIGAGPAGSVAAASLAREGRSVICLERQHFPRYVIGESLLPRCNELLERASMLEAVKRQGYMVKKGAVFMEGERRERFQFSDSLDGDAATAFQVPREHFDQVLATEARKSGVDLRFGHKLDAVAFGEEWATASVRDVEGRKSYRVKARFVLDASGYARVLPRLLDLERPAALPPRVSCFTQITGDRRPEGDMEGDVWISVHPRGGWTWVIPFSNGRTSVGLVCDPDVWSALRGDIVRDKLWTWLSEDTSLGERLQDAVIVAPTRVMKGYSKKVSAMHGDRWALIGNSSDFLDPVFSAGVTLALETALLAAGLVDRTLGGEDVDWDEEFDSVVDRAVAVFLELIESWYRGDLRRIFFAPRKPVQLRREIASVLGGHALRDDNPFVVDPKGRLDMVLGHLSAAGY